MSTLPCLIDADPGVAPAVVDAPVQDEGLRVGEERQADVAARRRRLLAARRVGPRRPGLSTAGFTLLALISDEYRTQ